MYREERYIAKLSFLSLPQMLQIRRIPSSPGTASSVPVSAADRLLQVTEAAVAVVDVADGVVTDGAGILLPAHHLGLPQLGRYQLLASVQTAVADADALAGGGDVDGGIAAAVAAGPKKSAVAAGGAVVVVGDAAHQLSYED